MRRARADPIGPPPCAHHPQGLGEGVALPAMSNLVASHIPPAAKARALGMCFSGFHSGETRRACTAWGNTAWLYRARGLTQRPEAVWVQEHRRVAAHIPTGRSC